jgi:hypothetical protein
MLRGQYAGTLYAQNMQAIATTLKFSALPPFLFSQATVSLS